jgi:hypothetical protein
MYRFERKTEFERNLPVLLPRLTSRLPPTVDEPGLTSLPHASGKSVEL